jgi:hypothetical protein
MVRSLLGSIKYAHGPTRFVWVLHRVDDEIHYHILLGTAGPVDGKWLTGRWARLMSKHGSGYSARDCYCKLRDFPLAVLSYALGINRNHERPTAPWAGLTGRIVGHNLNSKLGPSTTTHQNLHEDSHHPAPAVEALGDQRLPGALPANRAADYSICFSNNAPLQTTSPGHGPCSANSVARRARSPPPG